MKKLIESIKTMFRHNQGLSVAVVIAIAMAVWLIGCDSRVKSPFNPAEKLTRDQLIIEVENYNKQVELAYKDLDKQDLFKQKIFEIGVVAAEGGTVNPVGAGITLLGILGIGAAVDNRRKDTIIKTLKSEPKVPA